MIKQKTSKRFRNQEPRRNRKKVPLTGGEVTKAQLEVLHMLNDGYTHKQIAARRGTSERAVRKIKQKLQENGLISRGSCSGGGSHQKPEPSAWRLHGFQFIIRPYYFYPRYEKTRLEIGNHLIPWRQWKINLHKDTVEIYLARSADFCHNNKYEAIRKLEESLNRTIFESGNRFGFEVFKDGKANIRCVKQSYAINPSDIAKQQKEYLAVRGHDGKIWFIIDKSEGWEHEYVNPQDAFIDSEKVEEYFNILRHKEVMNPQDTMIALYQLAQGQKLLTQSMQGLYDIVSGVLSAGSTQSDNKPARPNYVG